MLVCLLPMTPQTLTEHLRKVGRMNAHLGKSPLWDVGLLVGQVGATVSDAPIAQTTVTLLLVELKVRGITRVATVVLPHTGGRLKVTGKDGGRLRSRRAPAVHPMHAAGRMAFVVWRALPELARINNEIANARSCQNFVEGLSPPRAKSVYPCFRGCPVASRAVRAFGQPEPVWGPAEMAPMGRHADLNLRAYTIIETKQWEVGMSRRGGDHLEVFPILEAAEGTDNVFGK